MAQRRVDAADHGSSSMYRAGCRCAPCRDAHREDAARRRKASTDQFTRQDRRDIAKRIAKGVPVTKVADDLGVPFQRIYRLAEVDEAVHRAVYDVPDGEPVALRT